jgi:hypothetical protein
LNGKLAFMKNRIILAVVILGIVTGLSYYLYAKHNPFTYYSDEVHVHADFLIMVNDTRIDLTDEKYQSSVEQILHKNVHLHDGEDNVVHRHAEGITFAEFLSSLGFTLTNDCLSNDGGESFCTSDEKSLALYVNEILIADVTSYIPQEEDRILVYYGAPNSPKIAEYQAAITDESCIYSGTCPERGVAPPESCGLTCEI